MNKHFSMKWNVRKLKHKDNHQPYDDNARVPNKSKEIYTTITNWSTFKHELRIKDSMPKSNNQIGCFAAPKNLWEPIQAQIGPRAIEN